MAKESGSMYLGRSRSLQDLFTKTLQRATPPSDQLLAAVWAGKLRNAGHRVTKKRMDFLRELARRLLAGESTDDLQLRSRREIVLEVDAADIAAVDAAIDAAVSASVQEVLPRVAKRIARDVMRAAPAVVTRVRKSHAVFESSLRRTWGRMFDDMRALLTLCIELGEIYGNARRPRRLRTVADVLLRLHARACVVAGEVVTLLESGYAGGALARWRTLHELEVVASLIAEHGHDAAKRYREHAITEEIRIERSSLLDPASLDLGALLGARRARWLRARERGFEKDYGWAAAIAAKAQPTFRDLEDLAGRRQWRQAYVIACGAVHAGTRETSTQTGTLGTGVYLVGPSNAELEVPADWTVRRLTLLTMLLVDRLEPIDSVVALESLNRLADKALGSVEACEQRFASAIAVRQLASPPRQRRRSK